MALSPKTIDLIIPAGNPSLESIEAAIPPRALPAGARVVRVAPSPTGFAHFGLVFTAFINQHIAHRTGGVFFLRIEDTDKNREVTDGIAEITNSLKAFGISYAEGPDIGGPYAPYVQSERQHIYLAAARILLENDNAYPCFCTKEELEAVRHEQEANKVRPGYYGQYAKCRHLTDEQIAAHIAAGKPYVLRFKTPENPVPVVYTDAIKGALELPGNDVDYVIVKSGDIDADGKAHGLGLPLYHLAAMVDDHLQGVNLVIRGDEWLSSFPVHHQIITALGWQVPEIGHLAPILKSENGGKRKLSKRKDPEAAVRYYLQEGLPTRSVHAYVLRLADSTFEEWRLANPNADLMDFPFEVSHMSGTSGALFDPVKLNDISKNEIAELSGGELYTFIEAWAKEYNPEFHAVFTSDSAYSTAMLSIERDGPKKRKDISRWSEVPALFGYFYDSIFANKADAIKADLAANYPHAGEILTAFTGANLHNCDALDKDTWLAQFRALCTSLGYAATLKEFKAAPGSFKGHIGDVSMVIRKALTGTTTTPDLYEMMKVMGTERVAKRLTL